MEFLGKSPFSFWGLNFQDSDVCDGGMVKSLKLLPLGKGLICSGLNDCRGL